MKVNIANVKKLNKLFTIIGNEITIKDEILVISYLRANLGKVSLHNFVIFMKNIIIHTLSISVQILARAAPVIP